MRIHDVDMPRFVTGSDIGEIHARGGVRIDSPLAEAGDAGADVVTLRHATSLKGWLTADALDYELPDLRDQLRRFRDELATGLLVPAPTPSGAMP